MAKAYEVARIEILRDSDQAATPFTRQLLTYTYNLCYFAILYEKTIRYRETCQKNPAFYEIAKQAAYNHMLSQCAVKLK